MLHDLWGPIVSCSLISCSFGYFSSVLSYIVYNVSSGLKMVGRSKLYVGEVNRVVYVKYSLILLIKGR